MPTEDLAGNDMAPFSGLSIENGSEFTGAAAECFPGLSLDDQQSALFEAMGGNPLCWYGLSREERRQAFYEIFGGTESCFLGRSQEDQLRLLYEAIYASASSTASLVTPACFNGLSPDLKNYNIFAAASLIA